MRMAAADKLQFFEEGTIMENFLLFFVVIAALICLLGFFNEKVTKLTYEISLMLFAVVIGVIVMVAAVLFSGTTVGNVLKDMGFIDIEGFLLEGVLCFMLFAGSCRIKLTELKQQARQITVLSFVGTFLGSCFYGFMFYGAGLLLGADLSLPVCLMFGSIVAPTDPIAATSILSKFGLPKNISFLIEGESLFNDGVGVALFVCFSGMVTASSSEGFVTVMLRELLGAVLTGIVVTILCFLLYRFTKSKTLGIFVSLLTVSLSYVICESFDFSGAIASVVCGILFSALRQKFSTDEPEERRFTFDSFWETLDVMLNSALYVMLGLSFVSILQIEYVLVIALVAIVANFIARAASVSICSLIMGKIPDGYDRLNFIKLFTWGALRGGLSVALAMSAKDSLPEQTYYMILGGTYAIVFFTTVIQGLTMKKVYNRINNSVMKKAKS